MSFLWGLVLGSLFGGVVVFLIYRRSVRERDKWLAAAIDLSDRVWWIRGKGQTTDSYGDKFLQVVLERMEPGMARVVLQTSALMFPLHPFTHACARELEEIPVGASVRFQVSINRQRLSMAKYNLTDHLSWVYMDPAIQPSLRAEAV